MPFLDPPLCCFLEFFVCKSLFRNVENIAENKDKFSGRISAEVI